MQGKEGIRDAALRRVRASVAALLRVFQNPRASPFPYPFHAGLLSFPMAPAHLDHLSNFNFFPATPPSARPRTSARGSPAPPRAPPSAAAPSTARQQGGPAAGGVVAENREAVEGRFAGASSSSGARDQARRDGGGSTRMVAGAGRSAGMDVTREEVVAMQRALLLSRAAEGRAGGRDGGALSTPSPRAQTSLQHPPPPRSSGRSMAIRTHTPGENITMAAGPGEAREQVHLHKSID